MKLILTLLLLIFIALNSNIPEHTKNNSGYKLELLGISFANCEGVEVSHLIINRIVSKRVNGDTLFINISYVDNCGYGQCWDPAIKYTGDSLIIKQQHFPLYDKDGSELPGTDCSCCFSADLIVKGINDTSFVTKFNDSVIYLNKEKYKTYPESFLIYKGDTVNRTNKYGHPIGTWIQTDSLGNLISRVFYQYRKLWIPEIKFLEVYENGILLRREEYFRDSIVNTKWDR